MEGKVFLKALSLACPHNAAKLQFTRSSSVPKILPDRKQGRADLRPQRLGLLYEGLCHRIRTKALGDCMEKNSSYSFAFEPR